MGLGHRFGEFLDVGSRELGGGREETDGRGASHGLITDDCELPTPPTRIVFSGRGKRRIEIEEFLAARTADFDGAVPVELMDYVPAEELTCHLLSGDVHLASLEPSWDGTMVPSKLQGSFAVGRPVLFVGSRTCSIGKWIIESGGGWVVEPGDLSGLRVAMLEGCDEQERIKRGHLAAQFSREHFDREVNAARVATLLVAGS
jgi:colanic acid biosynthesis glycosyl transferase WcaI